MQRERAARRSTHPRPELAVVRLGAETQEQGLVRLGRPVTASQSLFAVCGAHRCGDPDEGDALAGVRSDRCRRKVSWSLGAPLRI
jgi:hypothetical protein